MSNRGLIAVSLIAFTDENHCLNLGLIATA